jgi:hypothetical protein
MILNIELIIKDKQTKISLDLEDNLTKEYLEKVFLRINESLIRF